MVLLNFSYESFEQVVKKYIESNYIFSTFENYDNEINQKIILMRHDVDFDLDVAKKFALFEKDLGISSSYFFRISAKNYNLFSPNVLNILFEISNFGHEVGLHLDSNIEMTNSDYKNLIKITKHTLEDKLDKEIKSFSIHEPSRTSIKHNFDFLYDIGFVNDCYSPKFFESIKYISDSSARWREGHFGEWINKVDKLQVLTHPIWWFKKFPQENY